MEDLAQVNKKYGLREVYKQNADGEWVRVKHLKVLKKWDVFKLKEPSGDFVTFGGESEFVVTEPVNPKASVKIPIKCQLKSDFVQDIYLERYVAGSWRKEKSFAVCHKGDIVRYKVDGRFFEVEGTSLFKVLSEPSFKKGYPEVKLNTYHNHLMTVEESIKGIAEKN